MTFKEWQTTLTDGSIILWDDVRFDPGNNYDTVTGAYTAPYDGYYQFSISQRREGNAVSFFTLVEGFTVRHCWNYEAETPSTFENCLIIVKLLVGQRIQIKNMGTAVLESLLEEDEQGHGFINSWFAGHMLFPLLSGK